MPWHRARLGRSIVRGAVVKHDNPIQLAARHPPDQGAVNSEAIEPQLFISDDDRDFVAKIWLTGLLFCAVFWVAVFKFFVLPLFA